jgi:proton-translocating NADH-quinone oxidoreductase chain M
MLLILTTAPLFGAFLLFFTEKRHQDFIRNFSLFWSLLTFNLTLFLLIMFDTTNTQFQLVQELPWLTLPNLAIGFGLDGLSLTMIVLTGFLIPVCLILHWNFSTTKNVKEFNIYFLVLESVLFGIFISLDLLFFYLLFEAILIPMYFIIGIYGSRERKIRASYLLFLYTMISSVFMFIAILYLFFNFGTGNYQLLKTFQLDSNIEKFCWFAFFLAFAVKMPLVPLHVWLPEAHAEASTSGSIILAGILLKLGPYGFIRFLLGLFPDSSAFFSPFIYTLCIFSLIYSSATTLQQIDLKKIVAYSSIGHMSIVTIGIFSENSQSLVGSIFLMLSHSIVSCSLFLIINFLYVRYSTRILNYFSGLISTMPLFSFFFIFMTFSNMSVPGTSSFVGEFLVVIGIALDNVTVCCVTLFTLALITAYSIWVLNRVLFNNYKQHPFFSFHDLLRLEFNLIFTLSLISAIIGVNSNVLIEFLLF